MKLKKIAKKSLSMLLATVMAVSGLVLDNSSVLTVKAEESSATAPSVTAFATPEQLMRSDNFALHSDTGSGTAQKVYFGMNGESQQTWYIAGGEDHDGDGIKDSIVLLCDPLLPMAKTVFVDDCGANKAYDNSWNCTYETAPSWVYPNHYGASDLRGVLQGYTGNDNTEKFSAAEKELMQLTRVYTDDEKQKVDGSAEYTYYTEDKLYVAYGDDNDNQYITVGANSADSLNGGLKVSLTSAPYTNGGLFWLRAPYASYSSRALVAFPELYVDFAIVDEDYSIVPAFRLNLSSVLFASAATAATSDASLTDTMTFRVDGDDEITSQAYCGTDNVIVDAAEEETVYLYVQGKDGTTDWVYSQEVSADTTIATGTIKSGAKDSNGSAVSLTSVDLSRCKIWLEKKVAEDNLVYAVMAKETIATVAVTDITAPVAGAELDVAATCNTTGVSTTTPAVSYTKNGESVSGNAAGYLAGYTAVVELEAEAGYTFTNETTATINDNEASVSYDADTGKLTVSYTFDKTAKLPLGNAYYVTKDELMSCFDLDGTDDTVGKVYFGTNGESQQTWYIAGSDADNSIVLLCDPSLPMATGTMFENDWQNNKTYSADWNCTYGTSPSEVYPNHYGASDLRLNTLKGLETSAFTISEQNMMRSTKVYTDDDKRKDEGETDYTYYTEDVLYPAYGDYHDGRYITVGANSADSLKGGLKVSLQSAPYNDGDIFRLRAPFYYYSHHALIAFPDSYVDTDRVNYDYSVVPAFRLNLSSVLFASAATAATSGASLTDTMTFRVDGDDKITSQAYCSTDNVIVDAAEEETVYLYVQGKDGTTDWVYSQEVSADTTIATGTIKSGAKDSNGSAVSLTSVDLSRCEIWLEKKVAEDNLVYAVMAKELETITTVEVTDITAPVAGAELDVAATCNTTGVSTTTPTVSYTKNGESVSGNAAGYLAGYTAVVELEAEAGYTFTNETTATINDNEASVSYDADTGKLTVSYTFDKTAKLPLGNAYYVTKDELMSCFDLDGTDDTVGNVYFGTNGESQQTWYIAGSDAADSIVLLCDPSLPMATGTMFENDRGNNKTYSADWNCTYETAPNEVYPNHYGASDLRGVLQGYTGEENTEKFSAAEKELMQSTKVYTDDDKRKDESETDYTYYTEDVLYPAYGDSDDGLYITVGANSAESLNGGLKVSLTSAPYNGGAIFWLRAPYCDVSGCALVANPDFCVFGADVDLRGSVVPAFRLNLSSVLFASAATAATSDASLTDTMTFRVDGTEKIKSKAAYATCGVTVNYDEGDGNVFLYVQDAYSVYSVAITEDTTVARASTGIDNLTDESTKIWLEKSEDNLTYAVMAEYHENHVDAGNDGYCDVCGTKKDGISATLAGHSVSLGGQIGMNFYMDLDDSVLGDDSAYMLFTLPGGSTQSVAVNGGETENIGGKTYYVFTCEVAAKDMAGTITAKIVCGDGSEGTEYTYSVKDYAEDVMDKYEESSNEYKLAKAMLNYGAYAQKYFDPDVAPEKLANEGCAYEEGEFTVTTSALGSYVPTVTGNSATLDYVGSTLILEADIKVRHYFKLKDGQAYSGNLTQYVAPQENPVEGTYYYYESAGITAAALGDMSTPYTGVTGISISYCPLSYVTTVLANNNRELKDDTALQNLMRALYLYYKATVAPNNQS